MSLRQFTEQGRLLAEQAQVLREQVRLQRTLEPVEPEKVPWTLSKPGDRVAMRGVPIVGASAGAIRGTVPHVEILRSTKKRNAR